METEIGTILEKAEEYISNQEYPEAISLCKETLRTLEGERASQDNERKKMQLLFCLSDICHLSGNWVDGLMYLSTVIDRSSKSSDPDVKSEAVIRSGDILSKMGKWQKALEKYEEGEKLVKRFENPYLLGRTLVGRGVVYWRQGEYQKAIECADQGYSIGEEINNRKLTGSASALKASISFDMRDYRKALTENDRALAAYKELGDSIEVARILNNKGEVFKVKGDYVEAILTFQEGLDILANSQNCRSLGYLFTNLAECQARQGMLKEARESARIAENNVKASEDKYIRAQLSLVKALIEHSSGHAKEALNHITNAESMMRKLDIPYDMGIVHLEHARILRENDTSQAFSQYKNAIVFFKRSNNPEKMKLAETELGALGLGI